MKSGARYIPTDLELGDGSVDQSILRDVDKVLLLLKHWPVIIQISETNMNLLVTGPEIKDNIKLLHKC